MTNAPKVSTKSALLRLLHNGKEQGQSAAMLAYLLKIDPGEIPALVSQLQVEGNLVVDENGRYFIASTLDEWTAYRNRSFLEAAVELAQRHRAMTRSAAKRWPRQWRTYPARIIGGEAA